ncbi:MAG: hypothetical protein VKS61_15135 [Candidatus Sericytochromatia bacterium]|nr:hypothetical protein [Candidatus Sericytochromatia bacterium]
MMRRHGRWHAIWVAACVAACQASAPSALRPPASAKAATRSAASRSPAPAVPVAASPAASSLGPLAGQSALPVAGATPPGGLPAAAPIAGPAPLLADRTAGLFGTVRVPPGLVANNGGSLVGDMGGAYRLRSLESQVPLAGAVVMVQDAAGQPVLGPDGKPLQAVTDAQGRYAFEAILPDRNLIVSVALEAGKGAVQGVAVRATTSREANLDAVSTLATAYVVERFVKSQADPVATLEKLPGDVERDTRAKTEAALGRLGGGLPPTLTTGTVLQAVEAIRTQDATLDAHLDYVRSLLIVAGQLDLGSGRQATRVSIGYVTAIATAPDGAIYLNSEYDNRVWRVRPDGIIETAAGGRKSSSGGAIEGVKGPDAALSTPRGIAVDRQGRLLIMEGNRLSRLRPDGTLQVLADGLSRGECAMAGDGDEVYYTTGYTWDVDHELYRWTPAGSVKLCTFQAGTPFDSVGRTADGRFFAAGGRDQVVEVNPQTGATTPIPAAKTVDANGNLLAEEDDEVWLVTPAGARTLLGAVPSGASVVYLAVGPRGEGYIGGYDSVYRAGGGLLAGFVGGQVGGDATSHSFTELSGLAAGPDGQLYLSDKGKAEVLAIDAARQIRRLLGGLGVGEDEDMVAPRTVLRMGPGGVLHALHEQFGASVIEAVAADGTTRPVFSHRGLSDFAFARDGALHAMAGGLLLGVGADGSATERLRLQGWGPWVMAVEADGSVLLMGAGKLQRVSPSGQLTLVKEDGRFSDLPQDDNDGTARAAMTLDSAGRVIGTTGREVWRLDLATGTFTVLAGRGGRAFTGATVDDGVGKPHSPALDPTGGLLFLDEQARQLRRIPPDKL